MIRIALAAALALAAAPAVARPAPGLYCPVGQDAASILVDRAGIGIDGLDC
ncbi:hypothetical protein [Methylobacterium sp. WL6]|uniref:hypothetical protein n=1 Tax=Methylobacterium sp. WL6 TaxID=2603901 RepID=UPI00164EFDA5|nr:hypothetical protein [Methylobacterium sp. WL6]